MKFLFLQALILLFALHCLAQPVISSFAPASGPIGTSVSIQGSGFSNILSNNIVGFGGINAQIISATANTLVVQVPNGAICKPISVTVGGLRAESAGSFNPTFPGGGSSLNSTAFLPSGAIYSVMGSQFSGVADFNGDGKADLFCVQGLTQGLIVYVNNTIGHNVTFGQTVVLNTPSSYHLGAMAGDLDGDGKPDIVIANDAGVYAVSVYRNTSSSATVSFADNQDFPANNDPGEMAIGDMDGDGKPDLVISDGPGAVISILRNTSTPGNISFANRVDISPGATPASIAIRDLDGDGKPDLALTTNNGMATMRNLSSPGNFSFGTLSNWATGSRLVSIRTGDLDGDGKPDLASTDINGNSIVISVNNSSVGTISFQPAQQVSCFMNTNRIEINDMDGDGKSDIVSSNYNYPNVSVFRNTGSAGVIQFDAAADYMIGNTSLSYSTVADMDANGRPDIIGGSSGFLIYTNMVGAAPPIISSYSPTAGVTGTVVSIRGNHFSGTTNIRFGGIHAGSFTVNSDTLITCTVGGGSSGNLTVENADATTTATIPFIFYAPQVRDFYPAIGDPGSAITIYGSYFANITTVKFGNDTAASFTVDSLGGITAIVGNGGGTGDVSVISPNGTASLPGFSFSPPVISSFSPDTGQVGTMVTISGKNFTPDKALNTVRFGAVKGIVVSASSIEIKVRVPAGASYQLISVTNDSRRIAFSKKPFLVTFPSDDHDITTGSFVPAGIFDTQPNSSDVAIGDLDGDGKPDMVIVEPENNDFAVFLSRSTIGTLEFNQRVDYYAGYDPVRVVLQDLNGDGRPEIILLKDGPLMGNFTPSQVTIFSNNLFPNGGYIGGQFTLYTTTGTRGICVADMNGDALPDIVVSNGSTGRISVFPNTTYYGQDEISFGQPIDYSQPGHPDYITAADMDQDGRPDLISADSTNHSLTVFYNTAAGGKFSLAAGIPQPSTPIASYITAGDLDGHGFPNLVSGGHTSSAAIADLNGDGKADLGFGETGSGLVSLWQNNYPGNGPLSFTPALDINAGQGSTWFYTSDMDGDSKPDLVVTNPEQHTVSIYRNTLGDPVIQLFTPDTAFKGTWVTITGRNFNGVTSVRFGAITADSIQVISPEEIHARVAGGASGKLTVTTLFGIGHTNGFVFIPQIIPEGDTIFCPGKSVVLRSTADSANQWFRDGMAMGNDTTLLADSSGAYTVETSSENITTRSAVQMMVLKKVPVPVISEISGDSLSSSAISGNQWYYNGYGAIDTQRIIYPGPAGMYTVQSFTDGCMSGFSLPYYWGGAQAIQLPDDQYIRYYPNPVTNYLYIEQHYNTEPILFDISFSDERGNTLLTVRQTTGARIDVSVLPVGIIFMHIHADGDNKVDKTVKILKIK